MGVDQKREEVFGRVRKKFGFVPNVFKELALSPVVADAYMTGIEVQEQGAVFSMQELQGVNLALSTDEDCRYCKAAHTAMGKMAGLAPTELELIKQGKSPEDKRLASLIKAVRVIRSKRGKVTKADLLAMEARGIGRNEIYELVILIANKAIPTYINHIAGTETDKEFN